MESKRGVHPLIKLALLFHVIMVTLWALPMAPARYKGLTAPGATPRQIANAPKPNTIESALVFNDRNFRNTPFGQYYILPTGFWQYWDMFAPNPANTDIWVEGIVSHRNSDGSITNYHDGYPRMYTLPLFQKYFMERYRKFMERGHMEDNRWMWPYLAKRMAYVSQSRHAGIPIHVTLVRHFRQLNPPGEPMPEWSRYRFFDYDVLPEDLRR